MNAARRSPAGRLARAALLLAAAAAATVLAYPPVGAWPLAFAFLAPVVAGIDGVRPLRAFAAVWLYSVGMALVLVRWLVHALVAEYRVPAEPAWLFTVLIVGACALVPATAGALWSGLARRTGAVAAPLAFAALWALAEWLRAGPLGVPWLLLAQAVTRAPLALQTADLGGTHAVAFVLAACNAGIGVAWSRRSARPLAAPAAILLAAALYGGWRMHSMGSADEGLRVAVVQAAVPQSERWRAGSALRNTQRHDRLTRAAAAREDLDLVVWSETAVDIDLDETPALRARLERLARATNAPLVTGAPRSAGGRRTNSVVLVDPARGLVETYDKQRLVPFSEYDPDFGGFLTPLIDNVTEGEPYVAGTEAKVFAEGPVPFAAPICFEITYPDLVREFRLAGAELVLNLSNDAWFGRSGYAGMHFGHAVLRAVEMRTWLVRGANTGISAVIDPAGRVVTSLPVFEEGTLSATVGRSPPPSLYARAGDLPVLLTLLAVLAGVGTWGRSSLGTYSSS